jgi:hypothetical protein
MPLSGTTSRYKLFPETEPLAETPWETVPIAIFPLPKTAAPDCRSVRSTYVPEERFNCQFPAIVSAGTFPKYRDIFIEISIDLTAGSVTIGLLGVFIDISIALIAGSVTIGLLCASTRDKRHNNKTNIINIDFILISTYNAI